MRELYYERYSPEFIDDETPDRDTAKQNARECEDAIEGLQCIVEDGFGNLTIPTGLSNDIASAYEDLVWFMQNVPGFMERYNRLVQALEEEQERQEAIVERYDG